MKIDGRYLEETEGHSRNAKANSGMITLLVLAQLIRRVKKCSWR